MPVYPTPKEVTEAFYTTNNSYVEIIRLHSRLLVAQIPHDFHKAFDGWQICYPSAQNCTCSVIEHFGSYGHEDDKLEIMGLLTEAEQEHNSVLGWLTARNVFKRIEAHYKEVQHG